MHRVLVWPAGTEIGLEVHRALSSARNIELVGASAPTFSHAPYVYKEYINLPPVSEQGWLDALRDALVQEQISVVYPAHDEVIEQLAVHRQQVDAIVVSPSAAACRISRSKRATYRHFSGLLRVPLEYSSPSDIQEFPVFLKPDRGQGSQGTVVIDSPRHLEFLMSRHDGWDAMIRDNLLLEYLPGLEYTVDCFSDRELGLLYTGPRERLRVRNGISVTSTFVPVDEFLPLAETINGALEMWGGWFFQVKRTATGELALLEVGPRVAGTSSLSRVRGVNLPLLSIYEQLRVPVTLLPNSILVTVDRALDNRYRHSLRFERVYLDLDDTLIKAGLVVTDVVKFVFQCVNQGIPVELLTRHDGDLKETLQRHRLQGLFDRVTHVRPPDQKIDAIEPDGAIFIDDSYVERRTVVDRFGIPTFDVSMLEMLFDDRS